MQNTESGRKINQAMVTTGRAVATTGRAVGGAISQAKGALTSWWSNLTTVGPESEYISQDLTIENIEKVSYNVENNTVEVGEESNKDIILTNDDDAYKPGQINIA